MPTPSWDRLRTVGNSKLVKLTIMMPFVGYLIIFNQHVVSALHLASSYFSEHVETSLFGSVSGEFLDSRLRLLYFGLFLTGLGSSLFALFCPLKIKQYTDAVAFAERELNFLPLPHFYSLLNDLSRLRNPDYVNIDIDDYRDRLPIIDGDDLKTIKIQILTEWYWSQSHRCPLARWASLLFFICGFSLLSYPSAATLVSVLRATF
jgi:hypothetical protein